jgi:hypothetical protein
MLTTLRLRSADAGVDNDYTKGEGMMSRESPMGKRFERLRSRGLPDDLFGSVLLLRHL